MHILTKLIIQEGIKLLAYNTRDNYRCTVIGAFLGVFWTSGEHRLKDSGIKAEVRTLEAIENITL